MEVQRYRDDAIADKGLAKRRAADKSRTGGRNGLFGG
jgi:hypothetical protein